MMLRRTRAAQVMNVYLEVIRRYPDPLSMASAPADEVLDILRPLGLGWRAANIKLLSSILISKYGGEIPATYEGLQELPGVGDYVASAVCCFAFNQPMGLVDTNTVRVAGRYLGFETHAESRRIKSVRNAVNALTSMRHPRSFNYAYLDFAAIICTARNPKCEMCLLRTRCVFGILKLNTKM